MGAQKGKKQSTKVKLTIEFDGKDPIIRNMSIAQEVRSLVSTLKNEHNFNIKDNKTYCLINKRTGKKIPASGSMNGHGVQAYDTLILQESDPSLAGQSTGAKANHSVPVEKVLHDTNALMKNLDWVDTRRYEYSKNLRNYVVIGKALPPGQVSITSLLKAIVGAGTLTGKTTEAKRFSEHIEKNRCNSEEHVLLVFSELDDQVTDRRFKNAIDEMYAIECAFHYVKSKTSLPTYWAAAVESNQRTKLLNIINPETTDPSFVNNVFVKVLSEMLNYYGLPFEIKDNVLTVLPTPTIAVFPSTCTVPAAGGASTHQLNNGGTARLAFKVTSSNNNEYRVKPVFGFVEANASATLEVIRLNGPPKEDKLVIQYAEVPSEETDPQAPFKDEIQDGEVTLPLKAE